MRSGRDDETRECVAGLPIADLERMRFPYLTFLQTSWKWMLKCDDN